jgi:hypothetical protein
MKLRLAKDLSLPLDAVSRTFGILAVRGAGKSNTAAVMAEEMFKAQLPFCVIDPVGSWFGLRSSSDGSAAGLSIPIFGGKHGDVPLERGAGELIADLIVEKRLTCVLDLSRFDSESDKKAFLLAFARRLYQKNENPLHLFLEEADDYIPQSPMGDEKQLLRAWENIVRRGRARGIGMTLITQRSAAVAKMVLTQVETLFAMRTTGPQDIAAIEAWVKYHQVGKDVLSTLASLEDGEAWVWSPHYLKTMSRHQIRRRETFDSGATPKNVRAKDTRPPATLADIDLTALQERMAATIEKAKADDPRELRKQIADLKKQVAQAVAQPNPTTAPERQPKPVLTDADRALLEKLALRFDALSVAKRGADFLVGLKAFHASLDEYAQRLINVLATEDAKFLAALESKGFQKILNKLSALSPQPLAPSTPFAGRRADAPARAHASSRRPLSTSTAAVSHDVRRAGVPPASGDLPKMHRAMLIALAQHQDGLTKQQILVHTTYASSGPVSKAFADLARESYVELDGNRLRITDAGLAALGSFDPLPVGDELRAWLLNGDKLSTMEKALLTRICDAYPNAIRKGEILDQAGYASSGPVSAAFAKLVAYNYAVPHGKSTLKAAEELFS